MIDIGIVHYRIKNENEINAIWYSSRLDKKATGKGIAKGDTSNGFPGEYKITYFDPDGNYAGTFDLKITKSGPVHELYWSSDGEVLFVGVGIEISDGLSAGWRKAQ
jgi:hypothetical protein